ncbi:hypothetical protein RHGRI_032090 [Rhododendron griersonianum]|uniref:Leucine-rich repeat-containing N-terminal plant-type domain-containing protein n=1 Tax=Rhododendron griersonianum TaxID=479676 RepID=A0AAV6IG73_9ERIC|nr:hypothetical protein RHGRI_032090 [Rhododendron griersonianum]
MPKIGYTAEEWLTPLRSEDIFEPPIPGFNVPLQIHEPIAEEMSRRNIPRPVIPTKTANPARGRSAPDQQQQQREKRQKLSKDIPPPNISQSAPSEGLRTSPPKDLGHPAERHVDLTGAVAEAEIQRQFSPSYTMPDGRVLMLKDSVKEEPNLAVTLLRGLALPRDCDQVPTDLLLGLGEMCSHLRQAGQAALKANDKASKVSAELTALEALKVAWTNIRPNWGGHDPCGSSWVGIQCNNSRITSITLGSTGLTGQLTGDIAQLSELQMLHTGHVCFLGFWFVLPHRDLAYNNGLTGTLTPSIGSLTKLTYL